MATAPASRPSCGRVRDVRAPRRRHSTSPLKGTAGTWTASATAPPTRAASSSARWERASALEQPSGAPRKPWALSSYVTVALAQQRRPRRIGASAQELWRRWLRHVTQQQGTGCAPLPRLGDARATARTALRSGASCSGAPRAARALQIAGQDVQSSVRSRKKRRTSTGSSQAAGTIVRSRTSMRTEHADEESGMRIRVLVADDFPLMRAAVVEALQTDPGIEIVGQAADGEETLMRAHELRPDVIVLDLRMPHLDGVVVLARIQRELPRVRVLVMSASEQRETVVQALGAGAAGYITKRSTVSALREAVATVHRGDAAIEPSLTAH